MNKESFLINTSRGEIINEKDLIFAIKKGYFKGVALDILANEESFLNNPKDLKNNSLFKLAKRRDNIFLFPHVAGSSLDAIDYLQKTTIAIICNKYKKIINN